MLEVEGPAVKGLGNSKIISTGMLRVFKKAWNSLLKQFGCICTRDGKCYDVFCLCEQVWYQLVWLNFIGYIKEKVVGKAQCFSLLRILATHLFKGYCYFYMGNQNTTVTEIFCSVVVFRKPCSLILSQWRIICCN